MHRTAAGSPTQKNGLSTGNLYAQTVSLVVQRAIMHFAFGEVRRKIARLRTDNLIGVP